MWCSRLIGRRARLKLHGLPTSPDVTATTIRNLDIPTSAIPTRTGHDPEEPVQPSRHPRPAHRGSGVPPAPAASRRP